ncbi:MAG: transposase [Planctomycetota bacterium]|nr:transposase [Planctomycetota bacterium]
MARVHSRLRRLFERRDEEGEDDEAERANELIAHLAAASIRGQRATGEESGNPLPGLFAPGPEPFSASRSNPPLVASGAGFSLHAGVHVPAKRRGRLEKLCRYIARPPLATERLSIDEQDRILYALRHPFRGKTHVVFTPRTLLERLCAMVPPPRRHLLTYHGVLAPASSWRSEVVPRSVARSRGSSTSGAGTAGGASNQSYRWAELMKRAFEVDVLVCECGARREVISCIMDRTVVRRILRHLGLPAEPLATTPPRAPPILAFGTRVTG